MLQSYRCEVISKLEKTSLAVLLFYCLLIIFRPSGLIREYIFNNFVYGLMNKNCTLLTFFVSFLIVLLPFKFSVFDTSFSRLSDIYSLSSTDNSKGFSLGDAMKLLLFVT